MKKLFLFICWLPVCSLLKAQQFGGHPPSTKWQQINTDTVRVIFPAGTGLEGQAADIAATAQKLAIKTAPTIGDRVRKISIVLQPKTTIANAYVGLGPWRSEFYLIPQQNSFELGSLPWYHSLVLHEYRHVQQFNNFRKGLSRAAYYLFGQDGLALANSAAVPNWFWEGDAVYQETLESRQGRGRLPFFFNDYRSLWMAGKNYSWMKLRNGSLRDFVPDHYRLGYMQVAYGREKYGADFWKNVTSDAVKYNGLFYPFQHAIKKYSTTSYKTFRKEAFDYFKTYVPASGSDTLGNWAHQQKHFAGDEEFPQWIDANSVVLVKSSYKRIPGFYIRNMSTGEDRRIRTKDISLDNYFSYRNGKIVYAAYEPDTRWAWKDYSVLRVLDVKTGSQRTLSKQSYYFAPDISADGKQIVTVEVKPGGQSLLHILDAHTGAVLKKVPNPQKLFYTQPKFYDANTVVSAIRNGRGFMTLGFVNINTGEVEEMTPYTDNIIGFPSVQGDTITFTASFNERDELFAFINKKQLYKLTTTANNGTGSYQWSIHHNKAIYSAFTAAGYHVTEQPVTEAVLQPMHSETLFAPLFNYKIAALQQPDQAMPVDSSQPFKITKYHKAFNLVNFHSWRPYITDPDYTFSLVGQNVLNTLQTEVYFNYNTNEKFKEFGASVAYGAWFPYVTLGVSDIIDRLGVDTANRNFNFNELNGRLGLQVPLTFTGGRTYKYLTLSAGINHHQVNYTGWAKSRYADRQFEFADASLSFSIQSQSARQNIYPRLGASLYSRYRTILNKYSGFQWLNTAAVYLPGIAQTHNLVITGAYQKRDTLGDYNFSNSFPLSRGYNGVNQFDFPTMWKVGVNYHFPLVYPDWGVGNIAYLLRVRANAFYDYSRLNYYRYNAYLELRSVGGEVYFDTKWWNEYKVTFGIRYSRLTDGALERLGPNQWEFIIPVNLLNR